MSGPRLRTDVIDVYIFRRCAGSMTEPAARVEFLQLLRAQAPLKDSWHPVMGHVHENETAVACALRELDEEVGLTRNSPDLLALHALEQVHPFFLAERDAVMLSPRFAAEVSPLWTPTLDREHRDARWVSVANLEKHFVWPGQRAACREILSEIVRTDSPSRDHLRIDLDPP